MSNTGGSLKLDPIREIAAGSITTSYQVLGGPLLRDGLRLWMINNTNGDIYISTDGTTNMMKFPAASGRALDEKTNDMFRKTGTQFYIKFDSAPGAPAGWFGLEVEYA